jgi:hypothetical protein
VDEQTSANAQSVGQDAPPGPFPDASTSATALHRFPEAPMPAPSRYGAPDSPTPTDSPRNSSGFPSAARGPHRPGVNGAGARLAAERFGLNWDTAAPAVRTVAAEACARVPEEWEIDGPGIALSLGDAADLDPDLLAATLGPDGLGGEALGPQFGQDAAADALRPGPILSALTEQAVADAAFLTDDQLAGAMHAVQRENNRGAWKQTSLVAEHARRRAAQLAAAEASGIPKGRRPGEFPDDELASELLITRYQAAGRIEADLELTGRLPRTYAGMADGTISADRADTIASATVFLSDEDAAKADEILAAAAPGLRVDQLGRKAAALEMKLDPEAVRIRKEHARSTRQRVEVRRELSGNASLSGRELDTAQALASKGYIDAVAVKLRNYGGLEGTLSSIRALVFTELTQGRDPLDLLKPKRPAAPASTAGPGPGIGTDDRDASSSAPGPDDADYPCCPDDPDDPGPGDPDGPSGPVPDDPGYAGPGGRPSWDADEAGNARYDDPDLDDADDPARRGPLRPGMTAPLPAAINLLVPIGTLLGWSAAPATANGIGLLDPAETQDLVQAASQHPRTRWCATFINPDGTAAGHACAPGQHPWDPPPDDPTASRPREAPNAAQLARLRELLDQLKLRAEPIARGQCDHRQAEPQYTPSRKLKHLLRARTATCDAPGCNAQAVYCDQDHTTPWPDGPTDQCNLGPKCRRHHRCKQAPGWQAEQPEPGVVRWTLPNARTHTTTPTVYDL